MVEEEEEVVGRGRNSAVKVWGQENSPSCDNVSRRCEERCVQAGGVVR